MNKAQLISSLATKESLTAVQAYRIIHLIFDGFRDCLANGDRTEIRGFGSFVVRDYRAYTGRNPRTGNKVEIKPKRLPYFKVGKGLKDKVNGSSS